MTGPWLSGAQDDAPGGGMPPPLAFASSVAFGRDADAGALVTLARLLAVAGPAG